MLSILTVLSIVFTSPNRFADYKVFVTQNKYEADIWVYKTDNRYQAQQNECFWYEHDIRSTSQFSVTLVKVKSQADLIVWYTDNKYQAQWRNRKHKLFGRLAK